MKYPYKYLLNGQSLKLDSGKCFGCEMCINVCPHNVFIMKDKKAVIQNRDFCMECGACKMNCPVGAIEVNTGVGCATAILYGLFNKTDPSCGCTGENSSNGACCG